MFIQIITFFTFFLFDRPYSTIPTGHIYRTYSYVYEPFYSNDFLHANFRKEIDEIYFFYLYLCKLPPHELRIAKFQTIHPQIFKHLCYQLTC